MKNKHTWMLMVAMLIFGTIGLFVSNIPLSRGEIALGRAVLAAATVGLVLLLTGEKIPFRKIKKQLPLLLISGAVMGFTAYRQVHNHNGLLLAKPLKHKALIHLF